MTCRGFSIVVPEENVLQLKDILFFYERDFKIRMWNLIVQYVLFLTTISFVLGYWRGLSHIFVFFCIPTLALIDLQGLGFAWYSRRYNCLMPHFEWVIELIRSVTNLCIKVVILIIVVSTWMAAETETDTIRMVFIIWGSLMLFLEIGYALYLKFSSSRLVLQQYFKVGLMMQLSYSISARIGIGCSAVGVGLAWTNVSFLFYILLTLPLLLLFISSPLWNLRNSSFARHSNRFLPLLCISEFIHTVLVIVGIVVSQDAVICALLAGEEEEARTKFSGSSAVYKAYDSISQSNDLADYAFDVSKIRPQAHGSSFIDRCLDASGGHATWYLIANVIYFLLVVPCFLCTHSKMYKQMFSIEELAGCPSVLPENSKQSPTTSTQADSMPLKDFCDNNGNTPEAIDQSECINYRNNFETTPCHTHHQIHTGADNNNKTLFLFNFATSSISNFNSSKESPKSFNINESIFNKNNNDQVGSITRLEKHQPSSANISFDYMSSTEIQQNSSQFDTKNIHITNISISESKSLHTFRRSRSGHRCERRARSISLRRIKDTPGTSFTRNKPTEDDNVMKNSNNGHLSFNEPNHNEIPQGDTTNNNTTTTCKLGEQTEIILASSTQLFPFLVKPVFNTLFKEVLGIDPPSEKENNTTVADNLSNESSPQSKKSHSNNTSRDSPLNNNSIENDAFSNTLFRLEEFNTLQSYESVISILKTSMHCFPRLCQGFPANSLRVLAPSLLKSSANELVLCIPNDQNGLIVPGPGNCFLVGERIHTLVMACTKKAAQQLKEKELLKSELEVSGNSRWKTAIIFHFEQLKMNIKKLFNIMKLKNDETNLDSNNSIGNIIHSIDSKTDIANENELNADASQNVQTTSNQQLLKADDSFECHAKIKNSSFHAEKVRSKLTAATTAASGANSVLLISSVETSSNSDISLQGENFYDERTTSDSLSIEEEGDGFETHLNESNNFVMKARKGTCIRNTKHHVTHEFMVDTETLVLSSEEKTKNCNMLICNGKIADRTEVPTTNNNHSFLNIEMNDGLSMHKDNCKNTNILNENHIFKTNNRISPNCLIDAIPQSSHSNNSYQILYEADSIEPVSCCASLTKEVSNLVSESNNQNKQSDLHECNTNNEIYDQINPICINNSCNKIITNPRVLSSLQPLSYDNIDYYPTIKETDHSGLISNTSGLCNASNNPANIIPNLNENNQADAKMTMFAHDNEISNSFVHIDYAGCISAEKHVDNDSYRSALQRSSSASSLHTPPLTMTLETTSGSNNPCMQNKQILLPYIPCTDFRVGSISCENLSTSQRHIRHQTHYDLEHDDDVDDDDDDINQMHEDIDTDKNSSFESSSNYFRDSNTNVSSGACLVETQFRLEAALGICSKMMPKRPSTGNLNTNTYSISPPCFRILDQGRLRGKTGSSNCMPPVIGLSTIPHDDYNIQESESFVNYNNSILNYQLKGDTMASTHDETKCHPILDDQIESGETHQNDNSYLSNSNNAQQKWGLRVQCQLKQSCAQKMAKQQLPKVHAPKKYRHSLENEDCRPASTDELRSSVSESIEKFTVSEVSDLCFESLLTVALEMNGHKV